MLRVLLLLAVPLLVTAGVLHTLPNQYSAVVSANFLNKGKYTLSFNEYWDGPMNRLRTEGRFSDTETTELIDFNTKILYRWKPSDPSAACIAVNVSAQAGIVDPITLQLLRPSREFFTQIGGLNVSELPYVGVSNAARTIEADLYSATTPTFGNNYTQTWFSISYYFARSNSIAGGAGVPIRVELTGERKTRVSTDDAWTVQPIRHDYDWIMFVPKPSPAAVFEIPTKCKNVKIAQSPADMNDQNALFAVAVPTSSSVDPITPNPQPSPISPMFRAVIEAKLTESSQTVTAMKWYLDSISKYERLEYVGSDGFLVTLIYDYNKQLIYNHTAGTNKCVTATISSANANPLYSRAGSLEALVRDAGFFGYSAEYDGRVTARGVPTDSFTQLSQSLTNPFTGYVYDFDMSVMFYPPGWIFPGRSGVRSGESLPVRIHNVGTWRTSKTATVRTPYEDVWDLFEFVPVQPAKALWDGVGQYGCAASPNPVVTPVDDHTTGGSTAGIVVAVCVIGILLLGIIGYIVLRHYRNKRGNFHADVKGMAKATGEEMT